jgi:aspartate kinase
MSIKMIKRVFKFGGASVKDAEGIRNVLRVLQHQGTKDVCVVVSAMGKTTNAMETVVSSYYQAKKNQPESVLEVVKEALSPIQAYHQTIIEDLFGAQSAPVKAKVDLLFEEMHGFLTWNKSLNHSFIYDQIVGYGELLSTTIVSDFLNAEGVANRFLDIRQYIKTDSVYRDASVQWKQTVERVQRLNTQGELLLTQGFLGSDANNFTTTLGREGSDYTAAILAYAFDAESVSIWKDVPGVLNADPRAFENAVQLHQVSYTEAIELAFYGASVIHPKTLQPLQRKGIPLYVRSFIDLENPGTCVTAGSPLVPEVPCYIVKKNQVLLELATQDFSFMAEHHLSSVFELFSKYQLKVDLIQNSAISFRVCLDNRFDQFDALVSDLEKDYVAKFQKGVALYTIRHFDDNAYEALPPTAEIVLEQRTGETLQLVAAFAE